MSSRNPAFLNISNQSFEDRFIPNRSRSNLNLAHFKLNTESIIQQRNKDIFSQKPYMPSPYMKLLQDVLNYNDAPILCFKKSVNSGASTCENNVVPWPCNPRSHSILYKPDIILDLPNFPADFDSNILDWGPNYMATVSENEVFLWNDNDDKKQQVKITGLTAYKALKWNHRGTQLAIAGKHFLEMWAMSEEKALFHGTCFCPFYTCYITAIAWDRSDNFLVSGCSKGVLRTWNLTTSFPTIAEKTALAHKSNIITLAFCPSNKYLCSSGADGRVRIWIWPSMEAHFEIIGCGPVRAIALHPWKDSLLAVGGGLGIGSLAVWNLNTINQLEYLLPEKQSFVDSVIWNPVTGELVSSHQVIDSGSLNTETKILVHSSLNRIVDVIDWHTGRVLYLMWDSTGSKLATCGSEEMLCIWNFLNNSSTKNKNSNKSINRKRSVLSYYERCIR